MEAIKSAASSGPIPFFTSDSAAYHSLKHYGDIRNTEDRAPKGGSELEAYLESSRKTIAGPDEKVITEPSQFSASPAFKFFRTVKAAPGLDKAQPVRMRAIVVVGNDGAPKVATYFQD